MNKTILYLVRAWGLMLLLLLTPSLVCANYVDDSMRSSFSRIHMTVALFTSGIFIAALGLALLLLFQARRLHSMSTQETGFITRFLDRLPSVLTLEKQLFRLLALGFVLLTVLVGSGMLFGKQVWGTQLVFNHKVVFTLLAWLVFGMLIFGRYVWGWRGQRAIHITIFGFVLLFLSYVGTHLVYDVLKHSS